MRLRNPMLVLASIGFFACGGQAADDIGFHYPECVGTAGDTIDVGVVNAGSMELSGLAAMRTDASILWTFGDSGNPAELYALDPATGMPANGSSDVSITNVANFDWEDIATAPCSAGECIYIADTGDNDLVRNNVTIYEVVPPGPIAARCRRAASTWTTCRWRSAPA